MAHLHDFLPPGNKIPTLKKTNTFLPPNIGKKKKKRGAAQSIAAPNCGATGDPLPWGSASAGGWFRGWLMGQPCFPRRWPLKPPGISSKVSQGKVPMVPFPRLGACLLHKTVSRQQQQQEAAAAAGGSSRQQQAAGHCTMGNWLVNHWFSAAVLAAWLGINIFLFTYYFLFFDWDERYFYTRAILGSALAWARASAKCLNFNSMLILLPVCRNLLSFLRGTCSCCRRTLRKQLDHNLTFHKLVAYALVLFTAVHTIAHLFNLERYNQSQQATDRSLPAILSKMHLQGSNKWLNPIHSNQTSWKWVLAPVLLYIFERILRVWRAWQKVVVKKVVMHPARVLELQMQKKGFHMEVGQYIFVNCPAISLLEWHPFTLTSAPEEDFFSIHIRAAGDWTERLIDTFQQQKPEMPRIEVDGPFGTASEDVFQYEVAMLVGAGIGVTPFASILKSIWYKFQQADQTLKTKKIYFYWLCRDTGAFAWFNDLLASLEQKMAESGKADFLTYRLFLTGWDTSIANNVALRFDTPTDTVTGLRHKTIFGRPMWNSEFAAVAAAHPRSVVGVFLCGPAALAKSLQKSCHQHSSLDPRKVKFYFNKENF
ncbi:NADPH oxidase 1 isoform X3 [Apus apus]|uniref:NADPH oxidase 1 isoform X3 n=1 Tax=Apus apus TaxID=8895 RepID=UPI0021F814B5|nr:NADPH oxidase 1 isoform X3 [Apus apus]